MTDAIAIGPECLNRASTTNAPCDLLPRDWVKVCRNQECFWVRVATIDEATITGTVDNHPVRNGDLRYGALVAFEMRNVYETLRCH